MRQNFYDGGLAGTRTRDQRLKRPLLYRLSYQPPHPIEGTSKLNEPFQWRKKLSGSAVRRVRRQTD